MKVILNADVPHLGEEGDVKDVKSGYARNFLIPRKLGLPYNNASLAVIEGRRQLIEKRREDKRREALGMKERLESTPLTISMTTGRNGKLFGSVNAATIAGELAKQGIEVERKAIEVPENSIKTVGNFKVGVKLYGGETAQLTVSVTSSQVVAEQEEKAPAPSEAAVPAEETAEAETESEVPVESVSDDAVQDVKESEESEQDSTDDE